MSLSGQMRRKIVDLLKHRTISALRCVSKAPELTLCVLLPLWAGTCGPESEDDEGRREEGEKEKHFPFISGLPAQLPGHCCCCVTCAVSSWLCLIWGIKPKKYH